MDGGRSRMWAEGDRVMAAALVQMSLGYRGLLAVRSRAAGPVSLGLVSSQLRAFSVRKEPELEENPYYGKYRDRIQQLRRSDPAAFAARMEKKERVQPVGSSSQSAYVRSVEGKVKSGALKKEFAKNRTLDSLLNLELVKDKSPEDIAQIWTQFFATRDTVFAVIPGDIFDLILRRSQCCPSFLYALPRKDGYEFFVGQWSGAELHFTALINIQTAGDAAPSQLILYHYNDLQADKGIVLMTAECDAKSLRRDPAVNHSQGPTAAAETKIALDLDSINPIDAVNVQEAQCLANQVQLFYSGDQYELVETFNHKPNDFRHMAVVSVLEQNHLGRSGVDS